MKYKLFDIQIDALGIDLPIHTYGVLIVTGFLCGLFVAWQRAKRAGIEPALVTDVGVSAIFAGMLGAKVFYLIERHNDFGWTVFNVFDGGLSWTGALVGMGVGVVLYFFFRGGSARGTKTRNRKGRRVRLIVALLAVLALGALAGARADWVRDEDHKDPAVVIDPITGQTRAPRPYDTRIFDNFGSGFVFYGGILPAVFVIWIMLKVRKAPMLILFDIIAPSLMIGLAFGRIGCHMTGCCFGQECRPDNALSAVSITFPEFLDGKKHPEYTPGFLGVKVQQSPAYDKFGPGEDPARSKPLYPSELFMSITAFAWFWVLTWFSRKPRRSGAVVLLLGILYPVGRFVNEMFRGDNVYVWHNLRISQWVSLLILAVVIPITIVFVIKGRRGKKETLPAEKAEAPAAT